VSFYVSTATFFLLHCDEWDRVVALPRHKFVTGATLLQLVFPTDKTDHHDITEILLKVAFNIINQLSQTNNWIYNINTSGYT
jgi:hypothetical protein